MGLFRRRPNGRVIFGRYRPNRAHRMGPGVVSGTHPSRGVVSMLGSSAAWRPFRRVQKLLIGLQVLLLLFSLVAPIGTIAAEPASAPADTAAPSSDPSADPSVDPTPAPAATPDPQPDPPAAPPGPTPAPTAAP